MTEKTESELLAKWQKNNYGIKMQIYRLEQQYIESIEILNNWKNKDSPLYERHKSCVHGIETRLEELKQQLNQLES